MYFELYKTFYCRAVRNSYSTEVQDTCRGKLCSVEIIYEQYNLFILSNTKLFLLTVRNSYSIEVQGKLSYLEKNYEQYKKQQDQEVKHQKKIEKTWSPVIEWKNDFDYRKYNIVTRAGQTSYSTKYEKYVEGSTKTLFLETEKISVFWILFKNHVELEKT